MRGFISLLSILIIIPVAGANEEGLPIFKNFTPGAYEGGSNINSLISTRNGLLIAGDNYGVNVYDGENWNRIDIGFAITSMAIDSANKVYIAGARGIGSLIQEADQSLSYHPLNHYISTGKTDRVFRLSRVFNINGTIVFVLDNEIFITSDNSIRIIESPYKFTYCQMLDNELYFFSPGNGIFMLEETKLKLVSSSDKIINSSVTGIIRMGGNLYALTDYGHSIQILTETISSAGVGNKDFFIRGIQGVEQIDDTTLVVKTRDMGCILINSEGETLQWYNYQGGLVNNTVHAVIRDYWNNLWIGTAAGISTLRLDFPFSGYNDLPGIGTGHDALFFNNRLFLAASRGLYYFSINGSGNKELVRVYEGDVKWLSSLDNVLCFGGSKGIFILDGTSVKRVTDSSSEGKIKGIPGRSGKFLAGTSDGLLVLSQKADGTVYSEGRVKGIETEVLSIETEDNDVIWVGTNNSVFRFFMNETLSEARDIKRLERIESGNLIKGMFKFRGSVHLIADSGVYHYESGDLFRMDTLFDKLFREGLNPSRIVIDNRDLAWVFSEGKIGSYRFEANTLKKDFHTLLDYANGTYPAGQESIYNHEGKIILIGQEEGFLGYHIGKKKAGAYSNNGIRKVVVTSRKGRVWNASMKAEFAKGVQNYEATDHFRYGSSLKFYFSAGCSKFGEIRYSAFLEGFDKSWPDWNKENLKEYTNLPQGSYMFIVRSINKSGEESYPAIFNFTILPPWYNTIGARIIYIVLFLFIILAIRGIINRRLAAIRRKVEKEQEEERYRKEQQQIKENLIKQQEIIKLRNEKLRIDNLYKSCELANATMGVIKKNQMLTELKEELDKIREKSRQNTNITGDIRSLISRIDKDIDNEENWKVFEDHFDQVHERFLSRMKARYPILTHNDLRLAAYLRMNLSTKEISPLMNISVRGVEISRYRLRKKLVLGRNENLNDFLLKF